MRQLLPISILFALLTIQPILSQAFSISRLDLEASTFMLEGPLRPRVTTTAFTGLRFMPLSFFRLDSELKLHSIDSARFFHPIDEYTIPAQLTLNSAVLRFTLRSQGELQTGLFSGYLDSCISEYLLRTYLKDHLKPTEFRDNLPGRVFQPLTPIKGIGFFVEGTPAASGIAAGIYAHWNARKNQESAWSADLRLSGSHDLLSHTLFYGTTFLEKELQFLHRAGVATLLGSGSGTELYAEFGISRYEIGETDPGTKMFFLFEPRLTGNISHLALTFFALPVYPENIPTSLPADTEGTYAGLNLLLAFGNPDKHRFQGGLNVLTTINPDDPDTVTPFSFVASPFVSMRVGSFIFDTRFNIRPLKFKQPVRVIESQLGFKVVF